MAFVITEPCVNIKDRSCIDVCPVDCIHPRVEEDKGERMLYIDPDVCIDCGACEPVCPVQAIFAEGDEPEQWKEYLTINADYYRLSPEQFVEKWGHEP